MKNYRPKIANWFTAVRTGGISDRMDPETMEELTRACKEFEDTYPELFESVRKTADSVLRITMGNMLDMMDRIAAISGEHPEIDAIDLADRMIAFANRFDEGDRSSEFSKELDEFTNEIIEILDEYEKDQRKETPHTSKGENDTPGKENAMFETMFKEAKIERACTMQQQAAQFKINLGKEVQVADFDGMRIFLQNSKYIPVPGGAECMICTVTLAKGSKAFRYLGGQDRKIILVGAAFLRLSHVKKLILLRAEQLRQAQNLTVDIGRPEGVTSTSLDREIASRNALAWEFKPKLIERTLRSRDGVVVKSATKVAQGIYANSDDHYKPAKRPFGEGGRERRYHIMDEEETREESERETVSHRGEYTEAMERKARAVTEKANQEKASTTFPFIEKLFSGADTDKAEPTDSEA